MFKAITKKGACLGIFIILVGIISCEKDFKDIGISVIDNNKFSIKDTILKVVIANKEIKSVRADGLEIGTLGQYLLGVYNNANYEKIEASIISQLTITAGLKKINGADTISTIDTVFLKLPYQATLKSGTKNEFTLDSIIGDRTKAFTLNIYQSSTYLSKLDPSNPSKKNSYQSNHTYQKISGELNAEINYQFKPNSNDTVIYIKRRLNSGAVYATDTVRLDKNIPFARIPLKEDKIKELFLDKYGSSKFESQEAFNNYFRGLYIEASGDKGSLISFDFSNLELRPSIEIYYTNTVNKGDSLVSEKVKNSFSLSNFSNSVYKMTDKTYPENENIIIQGTAGNKAEIKLFTSNEIDNLRRKNWLINDASLTFYVNQDVVQFDTIATPQRLFLYKKYSRNPSQIIDILVEGEGVFGGKLELSEKKPNKYTFRITKYVSDLLNRKSDYNPLLELRVFNPTDLPVRDTLVRTYNWNPKAVTILSHLISDSLRRPQLKISYSKKK